MKTITALGDLNNYDGTELSLVVEYDLEDGTRACEMMSTIKLDDIDLATFNNPIVFYSVYAHCKTGGVDCAGDFSSLDDAQIYCHALDALLSLDN